MRFASGLTGCCVDGLLKGKETIMQYLLSDNLRVVCCLHFEGAIVGPQVDGVGYAGHTSFINLSHVQLASHARILSREFHHHTISADSGPAILNSISAYFFQYPNRSGNLCRKRSKASRKVERAWGLELRFSPPSKVSDDLI